MSVLALAVKAIRSILLFIGIILLLTQRTSRRHKVSLALVILVLFSVIIFSAVTFFSVAPSHSFGKLALLAPFILYFALFTSYELQRFTYTQVIEFQIRVIQITFMIPIVLFYVNFQSVIGFNFLIYGEEIGGFVSNQIGWSSSTVILSSVYLLKRVKNKKSLAFFIIPSILPLLISGSRAAYLGCTICLFIYFLLNTSVLQKIKFISTLIVIAAISSLFISGKAFEEFLVAYRLSQNSYIYKSQKVDPRLQARLDVTKINNQHNPIVGLGLDMPERYSSRLLHKEVEGLHNSHLNAFFGFGYIGFVPYAILFIILPGIGYLLYGLRQGDIVFLFFFLLSGTEHNLGGGQFVFIPWATFAFVYATQLLTKQNETTTSKPELR